MEKNKEYEKLIKLMKICCYVLGWWPLADEVDIKKSMKTQLYIIWRYILTVILIFMVLGDMNEIISFYGEDMNETIECCLVTSAFNIAVMRMITFSIYRKDVLYIVQTMERDWNESNAEDIELIKMKSLNAYKISKFFILNVFFTGTLFAVVPALEMFLHGDDHKHVLPFRGYYFYNYTSSPSRYACTYILNAMFGGCGCITIAAATSFSLISTVHGSAKFSIVQKYFRALNGKDWISNQRIGICVRRHHQAIEYAEAVEKVINILALAQFVVSTGLTCFSGFQLTTMLNDKTRMTKYSTFLNAAILELFIFSFSGQSLKTESEEVANSVYGTNWMGTASSSVIELISSRSRKACTITAGKFYDMSHESFLKVMSSSFSYFSVLIAMKDE